MLLSWQLLSVFLVTIWLCPSGAICPLSCVCRQTEAGKRKVSCTQGGMFDPIPIADMDVGTEILELSAPDANHNKLSITQIFQKLKNLEEVHITKSNVSQIGMHAFWGVPNVRTLNLTENNISTLTDHNFRGLVNLVELNLDDNRIDRIQIGAFKHVTELRSLTLQRNLLQELVPRMFLKLAKLHVLKLSGNTFEELDPGAFKDIPDLRILECRGCGLSRINPQLYHLLPYLSHLDLGNNRIQYIPADEFSDLRRLHSLKLDGNLLPVVLEKTFVNQQQLKYLCLARNRLAFITNTAFLNLTSLVELDIGYNKLRKMEGVAMQHISDTLQRLVISGNNFPMDVVKVILQTLHNVFNVEMARLKIDHFPMNFLPHRIKMLNASWNNLTEVSVDSLPRQLQEVDLSHNQLFGLSERAVLKFRQLKSVLLDSNPWECSRCNVSAMLLYANKSVIFKELTCASPKSLKGRRLVTLNLDNDVPNCRADSTSDKSDKLSLVVGLICIVIFAIFSVVFVVCSCVRRHLRTEARRAKRSAELQQDGGNVDGAVAIFSKGEISFKFPLDLTERRMSVSTIDEIKKDTLQHPMMPNGTGI